MEQDTIELVEETRKNGSLKRKISAVFTRVKAWVSPVLAWLKEKCKLQTVLCIIACVFILDCVVQGISDCNNYYMTPVKAAMKVSRMEADEIMDVSIGMWNGLAEKQLREISEIMERSELFMEYYEELQFDVAEDAKDTAEMYGEDYTVSLKELGRLPLSKYELREYRHDIREYISDIGYIVDASEEFKATDWREFSYAVDLSKADAKKLIEAYGEFVNEMEPVRVTEGYELVLQTTINGGNLEKPVVSTHELTVIKLNGRWISVDLMDAMEMFFALLEEY